MGVGLLLHPEPIGEIHINGMVGKVHERVYLIMAITKTNPVGSRATRLTLDAVAAGAISTHWNIVTTFDGSFTIVTTGAGSTSGNVLDGSLSFIDIWLPPSQTYTIRTKHGLNSGSATAWSTTTTFESRGPLNSFEKYQALSGLGGVDNVVT